MPGLPPVLTGAAGWPVLQAMARERSFLAGLAAMHAQLGDVFRIDLPNFRPVVAAGPEASRQVLVTGRHKFLWRNNRDPVTRLLRHGVLVEDGEDHDRLRAMMEPALKRDRVAGHVESMWRATDAITAAWSSEPVDMLVEMRRLALVILMGTLFRVDIGPQLDRLWRPILRTLQFIGPGPWLVWPDVPRLGYGKPVQVLDDYLLEAIRARRRELATGCAAGPASAEDLLTHLIRQPGMTDELIRDQVLTLLIAGHDTSTALLAWALWLLGSHPASLARAQAEVDHVLGGVPPAPETIGRLPYLEAVIKETLRLYPPIHVGTRLAATDVALQDFDIPAGTRVMISIYLPHRDSKRWSEPERFSPERFAAQPGDGPLPFTYLPFGAGPRHCIGAAFAQVEARTVLARLLQTFDFRLGPGRVHQHMGATLEPRPGVLMSAHRRNTRHA